MPERPDERSRLVYSTDGGRVRSAPEQRPASSAPRTTSKPAPPADGIVRVFREKKGRGGKTVTRVTGLPGSESDLGGMLKVLKQYCGAGGAIEGDTLVIQGDHRERVRSKLEALGHRVKLAGG